MESLEIILPIFALILKHLSEVHRKSWAVLVCFLPSVDLLYTQCCFLNKMTFKISSHQEFQEGTQGSVCIYNTHLI